MNTVISLKEAEQHLRGLGLEAVHPDQRDQRYAEILSPADLAHLEELSQHYGLDWLHFLHTRPAALGVCLGTDFDRMVQALARSIDLARQRFAPDRPLRLLDLGGGAGQLGLWFARNWPGCQVVVVDAAPRDAALAWTSSLGLTNVEVVQSDLLHYLATPPAQPFDLVLVHATLYLLEEFEPLLQNEELAPLNNQPGPFEQLLQQQPLQPDEQVALLGQGLASLLTPDGAVLITGFNSPALMGQVVLSLSEAGLGLLPGWVRPDQEYLVFSPAAPARHPQFALGTMLQAGGYTDGEWEGELALVLYTLAAARGDQVFRYRLSRGVPEGPLTLLEAVVAGGLLFLRQGGYHRPPRLRVVPLCDPQTLRLQVTECLGRSPSSEGGNGILLDWLR